MHLPRGVNALLIVLLLLLVIGLAILATLQYRWIDRVSEAERQRMHANIDFAARRFADDLSGQLEQLFDTFAEPNRGDIAERYEEWNRTATHPHIVETLYVVERHDRTWALFRFDPQTSQLAQVDWPPKLQSIRTQLELETDTFPVRWPHPFVADIPAFFAVPRRGGPRGRPDMLDFGSLFEERPVPSGTIVELDRAQLSNVILPQMTQRHFSSAKGDEYDVALLSGADVIFRSHPSFPDGHKPEIEFSFAPIRRGPAPRGPRPLPQHLRAGREAIEEPWRLLVRRREGSLDALVAAARRRNLAISFGILFILAATVVLLLLLLRRADRLRALQTQFVAAISHDLNTPIAALQSAGENIKDGIVADREKLARYGETIVKESSRLGEMIEQVLEFAGMQARARPPVLEPVDVGAIIDEAVAQCRWLVDGTAIHVETQVDPDLPPARGDARALTRAVQNLVANAIRHAGAGKWVGVRATRDDGSVRIVVEDRGPGIDAADATHLFEPFYRGQNSRKVRGTGLGLTIVKQIIDGHGGSVAVERGRPTGAAFVVRLPAEVTS